MRVEGRDPRPYVESRASWLTRQWWSRVGVGVTLFVAVAARTRTASHLWLDEAQAVHIAGLPLRELTSALRQDGAPPLYYVLLHGWIAVFGSGELAVRSLSGVFSVAALPLMYRLGRRYAGMEGGWIALLLLATSPFAVAYATTARMYSLMLLLVVVGALLFVRLLDRPGPRDTLLLGLCAAALMLTHYWAAFLLVTFAGLLVLLLRNPARRRGAVHGLMALAGAVVLVLPWAPVVVYQLRHTGTPWSPPAGGRAVADAVAQWTGGVGTAWRSLLHLVVLGLGFLAIFGRPLDRNRIELDLRGRRRALPVLATSLGTLVVSVAAAHFSGSAYVPRYTTAAFVPFVLLLTLGAQTLPMPVWRPTVVSAVIVLGLAGSVPDVVDNTRTQAGQVAAALARTSQPGDVVAYCPDQLGPAVSRLAPPGLVQATYPRYGDSRMVDWVDYEQRNRSASPRRSPTGCWRGRKGTSCSWFGQPGTGPTGHPARPSPATCGSAGRVVASSCAPTASSSSSPRWTATSPAEAGQGV